MSEGFAASVWMSVTLQASLLYLKQILKLVDAEAQLGHAGFEQLPQAVLLHQTHKNTKRLLLRHLGGGERGE